MELKKERLIQRITALPESSYTSQPSPGRWSVAQVANHLYLSEKLSLAYLKKKLSYPDTVPPFHVKSWGSVLLIKVILSSPFKVKAPKAINMWEEQPILSPAELNEKWSLLRNELISFIQEHEPTFRRHLAFNHPFAGRLTFYQMTIFINDHMAHHIRQIDRILKNISQ
jgi:hypothetical protein